ncbi:unnamed protein product [Amoebophrya sp. A120]|nr:unnamed protein product [Amoebophrya sp. A120]|eukprot:GSA120T00016718001.1
MKMRTTGNYNKVYAALDPANIRAASASGTNRAKQEAWIRSTERTSRYLSTGAGAVSARPDLGTTSGVPSSRRAGTSKLSTSTDEYAEQAGEDALDGQGNPSGMDRRGATERTRQDTRFGQLMHHSVDEDRSSYRKTASNDTERSLSEKAASKSENQKRLSDDASSSSTADEAEHVRTLAEKLHLSSTVRGALGAEFSEYVAAPKGTSKSKGKLQQGEGETALTHVEGHDDHEEQPQLLNHRAPRLGLLETSMQMLEGAADQGRESSSRVRSRIQADMEHFEMRQRAIKERLRLNDGYLQQLSAERKALRSKDPDELLVPPRDGGFVVAASARQRPEGERMANSLEQGDDARLTTAYVGQAATSTPAATLLANSGGLRVAQDEGKGAGAMLTTTTRTDNNLLGSHGDNSALLDDSQIASGEQKSSREETSTKVASSSGGGYRKSALALGDRSTLVESRHRATSVHRASRPTPQEHELQHRTTSAVATQLPGYGEWVVKQRREEEAIERLQAHGAAIHSQILITPGQARYFENRSKMLHDLHPQHNANSDVVHAQHAQHDHQQPQQHQNALNDPTLEDRIRLLELDARLRVIEERKAEGNIISAPKPLVINSPPLGSPPIAVAPRLNRTSAAAVDVTPNKKTLQTDAEVLRVRAEGENATAALTDPASSPDEPPRSALGQAEPSSSEQIWGRNGEFFYVAPGDVHAPPPLPKRKDSSPGRPRLFLDLDKPWKSRSNSRSK